MIPAAAPPPGQQPAKRPPIPARRTISSASMAPPAIGRSSAGCRGRSNGTRAPGGSRACSPTRRHHGDGCGALHGTYNPRRCRTSCGHEVRRLSVANADPDPSRRPPRGRRAAEGPPSVWSSRRRRRHRQLLTRPRDHRQPEPPRARHAPRHGREPEATHMAMGSMPSACRRSPHRSRPGSSPTGHGKARYAASTPSGSGPSCRREGRQRGGLPGPKREAVELGDDHPRPRRQRHYCRALAARDAGRPLPGLHRREWFTRPTPASSPIAPAPGDRLRGDARLAHQGAQVMHVGPWSSAGSTSWVIEVLSSFEDAPAPSSRRPLVEQRNKVRGIPTTDVAKITLVAVPDRPGVAHADFARGIGRHQRRHDDQNVGHGVTTDMSITIPRRAGQGHQVLDPLVPRARLPRDDHRSSIAKVSIVGAGLHNAPG